MVKLQDGKQYVTRSGNVVTVNEDREEGSVYSFLSDDGCWYTDTGNYWASCVECPWDIVLEYNPEQVKEPVTEWKFPVGSTIKNRYQASGLYVRAHVKVLDEATTGCESLEYYCYDIESKTHSLYSKDAMERNYSLVED